MPRSSRKPIKIKAPKPSTSRQAAEESEESASEGENNQTSSKKYSQISQATVNIQLLSTNLVKYVLNHSCNKLPIKRSDMVKHLNIPRKEMKEVFEEAEDILDEIYGLRLAEVPETKSSKLLITYSSIPISTPLQMSPEESKDIQLLFIVLSYIFMKTMDVPEDNLTNFIQQLGVDPEDFTKSKDTFIRQLYLKRQKIEVEGRHDPHCTISWGERAKLEFDKKQVLTAVAKIMEKSEKNFVNQYHAAHGTQRVTATQQADESMMMEF